MAKELIQLNTHGFENEIGLREQIASENKSKNDYMISLIFKKEENDKSYEQIKQRMSNRFEIQKKVKRLIGCGNAIAQT